jgi:hypothetical protein
MTNAKTRSGLGENKKAGQKPAVLRLSGLGWWRLILRHLRRSFAGGTHHIIHDPPEIFETSRGNNNGIAASVHIFCDAKESSARILLQGEKESLPFDLHFVAAQRVLDHRGLVVRMP